MTKMSKVKKSRIKFLNNKMDFSTYYPIKKRRFSSKNYLNKTRKNLIT